MKPVIAAPLLACGVNATVNDTLPIAGVSIDGAAGTVNGTTAAELGDRARRSR